MYNRTYTKYDLHPFQKVLFGKKVGEIVPSIELPEDKLVVRFDHWDKDDLVNDTRLICASRLSKISKSSSDEEFVPMKKFGSDDPAPRESRRNKKLDDRGTEIIRRPARKNLKA